MLRRPGEGKLGEHHSVPERGKGTEHTLQVNRPAWLSGNLAISNVK